MFAHGRYKSFPCGFLTFVALACSRAAPARSRCRHGQGGGREGWRRGHQIRCGATGRENAALVDSLRQQCSVLESSATSETAALQEELKALQSQVWSRQRCALKLARTILSSGSADHGSDRDDPDLRQVWYHRDAEFFHFPQLYVFAFPRSRHVHVCLFVEAGVIA